MHLLLSLPNNVWRLIVFAPFLIIIIIIITSPRLLSGDILLFYVSFSLLLRHPELQSGDVLLFYVSFSLLLILSPQTKFGDLLFLHRFLLFFSPWTCPTKFLETDDPIFTKLHRKVDPHLKRCHQVLEFSKWSPLPWKPWTYVKIFDLTVSETATRLGIYIK